ncbi:MAG TPA: DsbC family protein [Burkholderiales bacterium]|nr:DsbC family protein [Burkholderiales bacterium]
MLRRFSVPALVAILLVVAPARADDASLRAAVKSKYPKANVESIREVPGSGLYELVIDGEIYYSDPKFDYLIDGQMIETKSMTNLTAARKDELERAALKESGFSFDTLPFKEAFTKVIGKGTRKLVYFGDPNCAYCRRFDRETLTKLDDVTVYVFLYPIITAESVPLAKSIWCSPDRAKAWDDYMLRGIKPAAAPTCDNPIEQNLELGHKFKIRGTPTFFLADGTRVPGALKAEQLEELFAKVQRK